jgi:GntR family transcriptional repressor for pyruvate dehydrogenase complex
MDPTGFTPLKKTTLAQRASAQILDHIRQQRLAGGDSLPSESKLSEVLGVSRTVVREALHLLQGQGVIQMLNGRSAEVRPIDSEVLQVYFRHALQTLDSSLIELMEVRRGLEAEAARLCALRRDETQLADLRTILAKMETATEPKAYSEHDTQFHLAIARYSGNTVLLQLILALRQGLREAAVLGLKRRKNSDGFASVSARHREIVHAIASADPVAATQAMFRHMDEAISFLVGMDEDK